MKAPINIKFLNLTDIVKGAAQICEVRIVYEEYLIGIFGTMCDYMKAENCKKCPFADTKDQFDECDPWREIYDIRLSRD